MPNHTITAVPGLQVGHAHDVNARTGCTVVLGPFRGAAHVVGFASGTRELDVLSPTHVVGVIDALLLTGGSAFGLAAADGVVRWLEERGRGYQTLAARVPIVPAAVLYDLAIGDAHRRPDAEMGYTACHAASSQPVMEGSVGVGAGATVGKLLGPEGTSPSGVGTFSTVVGDHQVGALVVVNAVGDVLSAQGEILAGTRQPDGRFADTMMLLRSQKATAAFAAAQPNTTLAVVATDAALSRVELHGLARQSANALARRIVPVSTPFDGDVVFALSTAAPAREAAPDVRLSLAAAAQYTLEVAIERAVIVSRDGTVSRRNVSR